MGLSRLANPQARGLKTSLTLKLKPTYYDALDARAVIRLKTKKIKEAQADFEAALQSYPQDSFALYGRGLAKSKKGDKAGAKADMESAQHADASVRGNFAEVGL